MKVLTIITGVAAVVVIAALWTIQVRTVVAPGGEQECTKEAKLCPDGSAVGRTGPNCAFVQCPATTATTATTGPVFLQAKIGQEVSALGVRITPLEVLEDSRCPVDVTCIWAGTVRLRARLISGLGEANQEFKLNQPITTETEEITLTEVLPAPKAGVEIKDSVYVFRFTIAKRTSGTGGGKACTMEAKLCPDGSAVGRTGPNCEFASCPTYISGVRGVVSLGPTCPVMRDPPEPQCADKPYATAVTVYRAGSSASLVVKNSDTSGAFAFSLPPGSYSLVASGGTTFPRCNPVEVTVAPNVYTTTTISCDTGIR